jgi:hypothetical protein
MTRKSQTIGIILTLLCANCLAQNDTLYFPVDSLKAIGHYSAEKPLRGAVSSSSRHIL